jgi:hypothetical protein
MISTPVILIAGALYGLALTHYADVHPARRKYKVGVLHGFVHLVIIIVFASLMSPFLAYLREFVGGEILYFIALGVGMIGAGFVGGFIWGLYLLMISFAWSMHANDAFSAMRLGSYRHFLRFRIDGDTLTIYPIGIDTEPTRDTWTLNPAYRDGDQDTPAVVPTKPLRQHLIESPISIAAGDIRPLREIAG